MQAQKTSHPLRNKDYGSVDIKSYGHTDKATLQTACKCLCLAAGANARSRAKQNNTMMSICWAISLTADAHARLLTYRKDYLINNVTCAPLMNKVIMWLTTINSVTPIKPFVTTKMHWGHSQALSVEILTKSTQNLARTVAANIKSW